MLPELDPTGTVVVFSSLEDFREHYEEYIRHGGLVVVAPALKIGSDHRLALRIQSLDLTHHVAAVVVHVENDTVGFAIERFAEHAEWLRSIAEDLE